MTPFRIPAPPPLPREFRPTLWRRVRATLASCFSHDRPWARRALGGHYERRWGDCCGACGGGTEAEWGPWRRVDACVFHREPIGERLHNFVRENTDCVDHGPAVEPLRPRDWLLPLVAGFVLGRALYLALGAWALLLLGAVLVGVVRDGRSRSR